MNVTRRVNRLDHGQPLPHTRAACRLVAAQIDLLDIREARLPLLSRALDDRAAIKRLHSIDRYARYARSQRSRAIRDFGSARPPVSMGIGQSIDSDTCGAAIDVAAVLRKSPLQKRRSSLRRGIGRRPARGTSLRFGRRVDYNRFCDSAKTKPTGKV